MPIPKVIYFLPKDHTCNNVTDWAKHIKPSQPLKEDNYEGEHTASLVPARSYKLEVTLLLYSRVRLTFPNSRD